MEKEDEILRRYGGRVGYSEAELKKFREGGHRVRQVRRLSHCNTGYILGDRFVVDADGNFISKLCPKRMCVYLVSQLTIPVALINERLSEGLDPNQFHFMHEVRCPDVGVDCSGYGEVMLRVQVVPRQPK
jgi:hypothetical protein